MIMISAKANEENIVEGFKNGCQDYIAKPFRVCELIARVSVHLRIAELAGALKAVSLMCVFCAACACALLWAVDRHEYAYLSFKRKESVCNQQRALEDC